MVLEQVNILFPIHYAKHTEDLPGQGAKWDYSLCALEVGVVLMVSTKTSGTHRGKDEIDN